MRVSFTDAPALPVEPHTPSILRRRERIVHLNVDQISNRDFSHLKSVGVRGDIDKCLEVLFEVYGAKQRQRKILMTCAGETNLVPPSSIHSIDKGLLNEYIQTVYKDYNIKDRLKDPTPLKTPLLIEIKHSTPKTTLNVYPPHSPSFCLLCQRPLQEGSCSDAHKIANMSLFSIKETLNRTISRLKTEIEILLEEIRNNPELFEQIADQISTYLTSLESDEAYESVNKCFCNSYSKVVELTRKLGFFMAAYIHCSRLQNKEPETRDKSHSRRVSPFDT